jgi:hypothetical protein
MVALAFPSPAAHKQVESAFLGFLFGPGAIVWTKVRDAQGGLDLLPGPPQGRKHLPWKRKATPHSLHQGPVYPSLDFYRYADVIVWGVIVDFGPGVGTNGIVRTPNASSCCDDGRPPSASGAHDRSPRSGGRMRKRNGSAGRVEKKANGS